MCNKIRQLDPSDPDPEMIAEAAWTIGKGGIVVFPTSGLYGLGADAFNDLAVRRIFEIKRRDIRKPLLILIRRCEDVYPLVTHVPPAAKRLMDHFWPGGLTLVFEANHMAPLALTAGSGKIGIRMVKHPVAAALIEAIQRPITGTSANISGFDGCHRIDLLDPQKHYSAHCYKKDWW